MSRYQFGGGPADYTVQPPTDDQLLRFAPNVTVTLWDSATSGSMLTDIQLAFGGESLSAVTTDAKGRLPRFFGPDGVTQLWVDSGDSERYVLVSTDLGDIVNGKLDASDAQNFATQGDISTIQRAAALAPRLVVFDPTSNTWPYQADVSATYPAIPIFWFGNAAVPAQARKGLDYIDQLEATNSGGSTNIPDPTPDPTPDPDVNDVTLTAPVASPNGSIVGLTATLTTEAPLAFAYAQIAVRGPSGQSSDTAFNNGVTVDGTLNMTGSFTASVGGTWTAYVSYNLTGGSDQASWIDGPKTTFTVTLPAPGTPVSGGVPLVGLSGLAWNSGCFYSSSSVSANQAFGTWRNRAIDGFLTFQGRDDWGPMFYIDSSWAAFAGVIVNSIPPQPQTANDAATAAGTNNGRWEGYGQALTAAGLNRARFIIRIWEVNGNWYKWSWGNENGSTGAQNTPEQFIAAVKNVSVSLKKYAPNVKISVNLNRGNRRAGTTWQSVLQPLVGTHAYGKIFDIVGLDSYDWYPGQTNSANWNSALNQDPGLSTVAAFCRSNGLQMSLEEWACIDASGGSAGGAGGDNAYYITQMWSWFVANADVIAYEGYYNDNGAPPTLLHKITDGSKPNAAAAYRSTSRWGHA